MERKTITDVVANIGLGVLASPMVIRIELIKWINWADALKKLSLKGKKPNDPLAPSVIEINTPLDWRDQYVVALGTAISLTEEATLRAGYNYARNPIRRSTLSPLLPLTSEHHITLGGGYKFSESFMFNTAFEYTVPSAVKYEDAGLPIAAKSEETLFLLGLWAQITYRWD